MQINEKKIKFCKQCKHFGHVISDCKKQPKSHGPRAFQASTARARATSFAANGIKLQPPQITTQMGISSHSEQISSF